MIGHWYPFGLRLNFLHFLKYDQNQSILRAELSKKYSKSLEN